MTQPEPAWQLTWLRGVAWAVILFLLVLFALDRLAPLFEDGDGALWGWGALYGLGLLAMGYDGARHAHHALLPSMVGAGCIFLTTMFVSVFEFGEQSGMAMFVGAVLAAIQLAAFLSGVAVGALLQRRR